MPIALVEEGKPVTASKMNEVIAAINAIEVAIGSQGISATAWATGSESGGAIANLNHSEIIDDVTAITQGIRVTFVTDTFAGDFDYSAVCTVAALEGSDTGYAQVAFQDKTKVEFVFRDDDGSGGNSARFNVNINYNLSL
jgi:hypothetical protein